MFTEVMIPIPFGQFIHALAYACGGSIPNRTTPGGAALLAWSLEEMGDDERHAFEVSAVHWTLACAFAAFGDVVRQIARQEEVNAPRGA